MVKSSGAESFRETLRPKNADTTRSKLPESLLTAVPFGNETCTGGASAFMCGGSTNLADAVLKVRLRLK